MKNLHLFDLEKVDNIIAPKYFEPTTLYSPATTIFTDFKLNSPLKVKANTLAVDVLDLMMKSHVQMKIVVSDSDEFLGIVSTKELSEQRLISEVAKGTPRNEILVEELMLPRNCLSVFDYQELERSKVCDVIFALEQNRLNHCLVVDREHHQIRGVISSSDIARKLHLPLKLNYQNSFNRVFEEAYG
ncbi:CBS domain-containing protein [Thalassotalea piscium]|uniref:Signal-transduction protein with cAMP-binding, CBS, and nucleotidyltransferase domain n=1 Tax=Thalassotalea piscium TaxID=1230533 RepID=A0A7X0TT04_9GAMM|nr:CBS domain-containing protein [Thalassotalea piscium]MBB6542686.1 signal-transduction protein with cAMP-binding, CBS, and nucleotidyltransferase domain [Thalassotalea piscium]